MANCDTNYLDCTNKNESLESIIKRMIMIDADGNLSLNICGCDCGDGGGGAGLTSVTYAELVALIGASGLTAGAFYLLTDFATKHYMLDGYAATLDTNTGTIETLILFATSANTVDSRVYSTIYPQDVIHYDWNPANWLADIGFASSGVIISGFKGVIFFRHSTNNDVSMGYDFRTVKFRRWDDGTTPGTYWINEFQGFKSTAPGVNNVNDYQDFLTFDCPDGETQFNNEIRNVHFATFRDNENLSYYMETILQNNVFYLVDDMGWFQIMGVNIGTMAYCNTFNGTVEGVNIGSKMTANVFGSYIQSLIAGNNFEDNRIEGDLTGNVFGHDCGSNAIGNHLSDNHFGNYTYNNIIGDYCEKNNFLQFNSYIIIPNKTSGNGFRCNVIYPNVGGTAMTPLDFSAANYVFTDYDCTISKRLDGTARLTYIDNSDVQQIVSATA